VSVSVMKTSTQTSVGIFGSTGSIGVQAIDVVGAHHDVFTVGVLAARRASVELVAQISSLKPWCVVVETAAEAASLETVIDASVEIRWGSEALHEAAGSVDIAVNAVVGFAGLPVTIGALESGRRLALANKESLIAAARVVAEAKARGGGEIVPVDSEHCAIHQCLGGDVGSVDRLILTASGGPFRGRTLSELATVGIDEALTHPTWSMGPKITIDSSTLINKGLEVIEAHALFGLSLDRIDVVVHPQSIVHSMVTFVDGSTIAQLSRPDMRLPIAYALGYPDRLDGSYGTLDFSQALDLHFEAPDRQTFRGLDLAYEAGRQGGTAPAWLSAANEVAVQAFLEGKIRWPAITEVIEETMLRYSSNSGESLESVLEADSYARDVASELITDRIRA